MNSFNNAPIVLFVYNRLYHVTKTIEALQKNKLASESELYIYSDGAKNDKDIEQVVSVRNFIKSVNGFKKITIIERENNWGLANSIIDGVTIEHSAVVMIVLCNIIIGLAYVIIIIAKDGDGGNNGIPLISETKQFCEEL